MPAFVITGSTGFIGSALVDSFSPMYPTLSITRDRSGLENGCMSVSDFLSSPSSLRINGIKPTHLIHCAALAHKSYSSDPVKLSKLFDSNVSLALKLADVAIRLGISRFIFFSSIGVHGSSTALDSPITEQSPFLPDNPYSMCKCIAEILLRDRLIDSCVELVIIRPCLVYGSGSPGNLRNLKAAIDLCLPLPFRSVDNARSFLSLDNLVSAVEFLAFNKAASGHCFVLSDHECLSTSDLIRLIARARNKPLFLFPVNYKLLKLMELLPIVGKKIRQLTSSLVVDSSKLRNDFGWSQPQSQPSGLLSAFKR